MKSVGSYLYHADFSSNEKFFGHNSMQLPYVCAQSNVVDNMELLCMIGICEVQGI